MRTYQYFVISMSLDAWLVGISIHGVYKGDLPDDAHVYYIVGPSIKPNTYGTPYLHIYGLCLNSSYCGIRAATVVFIVWVFQISR